MRRNRTGAIVMVGTVLVVLVSLGMLRGVRYFLLRRSAGGSERHRRQLQQGRHGKQRSPRHAQPSCFLAECSLPGHMHELACCATARGSATPWTKFNVP
jgi:hypothetical protein